MASFRIRAAVIYVDSKKVATAQGGSLDETSNDEMQICEGGISHSDGIPQSEVSFDKINPVSNEDGALHAAYEQKKYVKLKLTLVDGAQVVLNDMRCTSKGSKWDNKTGSQTSSWKFAGGAGSRA